MEPGEDCEQIAMQDTEKVAEIEKDFSFQFINGHHSIFANG